MAFVRFLERKHKFWGGTAAPQSPSGYVPGHKYVHVVETISNKRSMPHGVTKFGNAVGMTSSGNDLFVVEFSGADVFKSC